MGEREETPRESSLVLPVESRLLEIPSRLSLARTTLSPNSTDTSTPAQPILEPVWEPPSTLTFPDGPRNPLTSSRQDARNSLFSPVEPVENPVVRLVTLMTSPTSIVLDTPRFSLSRS